MTVSLFRVLLMAQLAAGLVAVALSFFLLLRSRQAVPRTLTTSIASGLLVAVGGTALALRSVYEAKVRQALFLQSEQAGWWMERREHLALGATLFAITSLLLLALTSSSSSERDRDGVRFPLRASIAAAAICTLIATVAGAIAAARL